MNVPNTLVALGIFMRRFGIHSLESFCCVRSECNESPIHQPIRAVDQFGNELKRAFGWLSSSRDPRRDGKNSFSQKRGVSKTKTDGLFGSRTARFGKNRNVLEVT